MQQNRRIDTNSILEQSQNNHQRIIFNLIEKVGAKGFYQKLSLLAWCICGYLCGAIFVCVAFVIYQDPYLCPSSITENCKRYVCSLRPQQRADFLPQITINSIVNQFGDYRCKPEQNLLSIIVLVMYLGIITAQLILALLSDFFRRKSLMIFGFISEMVGLLITIFSPSLAVSIVGLYLMTLGVQITWGLSIMFIVETVSQQKRQKYQVCVHISFALGQTANVGFYYWLRNYKLVHLYFYLIPALLAMILVIFFVVDTPICLIKHYEPIQALEKLMWIARVNNIDNCSLEVNQIAEVKQRQNMRENQERRNSKFTVLDLFRYESLRWMTILLAIMRLCVQFLFVVPNFMIDQFNLSIYINGLALGISSIVGFITSYFIISKFKRKSYGIFSFIVIFICSFTLIFFWKPKSDGQNLSLSTNIAILVVVIIINIVSSIQFSFLEIYTTQLFPSQIRLIAFAFIDVFGAAGVSVSDFILNACIDNGFSVMIVFSILAFLSLIASLILPQSLGIPPPDLILQLSNIKPKTQIQLNIIKTDDPEQVLQSERRFIQDKQEQEKIT